MLMLEDNHFGQFTVNKYIALISLLLLVIYYYYDYCNTLYSEETNNWKHSTRWLQRGNPTTSRADPYRIRGFSMPLIWARESSLYK